MSQAVTEAARLEVPHLYLQHCEDAWSSNNPPVDDNDHDDDEDDEDDVGGGDDDDDFVMMQVCFCLPLSGSLARFVTGE